MLITKKTTGTLPYVGATIATGMLCILNPAFMLLFPAFVFAGKRGIAEEVDPLMENGASRIAKTFKNKRRNWEKSITVESSLYTNGILSLPMTREYKFDFSDEYMDECDEEK